MVSRLSLGDNDPTCCVSALSRLVVFCVTERLLQVRQVPVEDQKQTALLS